MKVQKNIEVWLVKKRLPRPIDLVQYDTGIQLVFAIQDFAIPGGTTATLYVQKPSGKFVYQEKSITVSENSITIDLANQAITEHGNDIPYQVRLLNGTDLITTFAGIFRVEKSLADSGAVESKTVISAFEAKTAEQIELIHKASLEQQEIIKNFHDVTKGSAIVCESSGEFISIADASDDPIPGLHIYGKTTQNGTPTPDAPVELASVGASGAIKTMVCGKNLLNCPEEVTFTTRYNIILDPPIEPGTYTVSALITSTDTDAPNNYVGFQNGNADGTGWVYASLTRDARSAATVKTYNPVSRIQLRASNTDGNSTGDTATYKQVQIEAGSVETDYEPYKGQTITAFTPNGLHGVGEAKDEIDYSNGVHIQQVSMDVFDGTENWEAYGEICPHLFMVNTNANGNGLNSALFCSHFPYDSSDLSSGTDGCRLAKSSYTNMLYVSSRLHTDVNAFKAFLAEQYASGKPMTVAYPLATHKKTALSAEELAEYAALHTNKPNTIIYNDSCAHMAIEYNADTKLYVDSKFAELATAIVNNA